jgi:hypothetical protein
MAEYSFISVNGFLVEAALKPCPWCKRTPDLRMPLDQEEATKWGKRPETWVWTIGCSCRVKSVCSISIRNTTKTEVSRFLNKLNDLFSAWNSGNDCKAYEKKVIDLRMIPNLGIK